jgi:hypothetical protein
MTELLDQGETTTKSSSRRAVLIGALGGLGAWAAGAVTGIGRVRAADGEAVLVGNTYTAASPTALHNTTDDDTVFSAISDAGGVALKGQSFSGNAFEAGSESGIGVFSNCGQGIAFSGNTNGAEAFYGQTDSDDTAAIVGLQSGGDLTGVLGASGGTVAPTPRAKTGVFGYAAQDSGSRGVIGESPAGQGVRGETTTGVGLYGTAGSGYAIRGSGRVRFDRVSGVARINAGSTSVVVSPGVNVVTATFALLTPKTNIGTRSLWFTTNTTANTLTIHMSASRSSGTFVAWLLVG